MVAKQREQANIFNSIKQERKFKVVGQQNQQKRATQRQGSSNQKRKEVLLSALQSADRVNTFQDRRTNNPQNFQYNSTERPSARKKRKSKFCLGEGDEEGYASFVFKQGAGRQNFQRTSKKPDFIQKQKMLKAERQSEKDMICQKTEALDEELADIRSLINFNKKQPKKLHDDDYDKLVKRFEMDAKANGATTQKEIQNEKSGRYQQPRLVQQDQQTETKKRVDDNQDTNLSNLEARQRERAAGDDPLQECFRGVAAQLLAKYGLHQSETQEQDSDHGGNQLQQDFQKHAFSSSQCTSQDDISKNQTGSRQQNSTSLEDQADTCLNQTPTVAVYPQSFLPASYEEFFCVVHNEDARSVQAIINNFRFSQEEKLMKNCREGLERFYGYVIQYFQQVADEKNGMSHVQYLVKPIQEMTKQIPLHACSVVREIIKDYCRQVSQGRWPSFGQLHMFKLWTQLFEFNEQAEHSVLDSLQLLFGQILCTLKIQNLQDIQKALLIIHLGNSMCEKKFWPEARVFLLKCLASILPFYFDLWITYCPEKSWLSMQQIPEDTDSPLQLFNENQVETVEQKLHLTRSLLKILLNYIEINSGLSSFAELFVDFMLALQYMQQNCALDQSLQDLIKQLLQKIDIYSRQLRKPLNQNEFRAAPTIRQHVPKFEEDEEMRDVNKMREGERRLRRKAVKEERQAMRALRKDASLVLNMRETHKNNAAEERDRKAKRAISFLQAQEADFRSGGQAGMNPHLKKKK